MCLSAVCLVLSVPYVIYLLFRQLAVIVLTVILGVTILGVHGVIKVCCGGRSLEGTFAPLGICQRHEGFPREPAG